MLASFNIRLLAVLGLAILMASAALCAEAGRQRVDDVESLIAELDGLTTEQAEEHCMKGAQFVLRPFVDLRQFFNTPIEQPVIPKDPLMKLIAMGAKAIPALCRHLNDKKPIGDALRSTEWSGFESFEAFDWNVHQPRKTSPPTASVSSGEHLREYQITRGDLCFFALGQITNRSFVPISRRGNGPRTVIAPSIYPSLAKFAVVDWARVDEKGLMNSLQFDVLHPDTHTRDLTAMVRLVYYYPKEAEAVAIERLKHQFQMMIGSAEPLQRDEDREGPLFYSIFTLVDVLLDLRTDAVSHGVSDGIKLMKDQPKLDPNNDLYVLSCLNYLAHCDSKFRIHAIAYCEKRLAGGSGVGFEDLFRKMLERLKAQGGLVPHRNPAPRSRCQRTADQSPRAGGLRPLCG